VGAAVAPPVSPELLDGAGGGALLPPLVTAADDAAVVGLPAELDQMATLEGALCLERRAGRVKVQVLVEAVVDDVRCC
jgi:phosphoribosylcarboxyaminoimidazole (NCAIR) mutase